jgi:GT2 family glycosyltransferase
MVAVPAVTSTAAEGSFNRDSRVLISILNWNGAAKTLQCVDSIRDEGRLAGVDATILVIDNGSRREDAALLEPLRSLDNVVLKFLPKNLGFTGGHNVAIQIAMDENYDFIWLLNNDATVLPATLKELVELMQATPRCGAVSPVIRDVSDGVTVIRCVNTHDFEKRTHDRIISIEEGKRFQRAHPDSVWVDGTAVLFRIAALRQTGGLDDRLFAYYDDNDIGLRLAAKGWISECAFGATVLHEVKSERATFPTYMVYLLQRNEMLFWTKHTPASRRRFLSLRMLDRALYDANRLYRNGMKNQGDATLLGIADFFGSKFGAPNHDRKVPLPMQAACKLSALFYRKKLYPRQQSA